jgi:hypothetical protein
MLRVHQDPLGKQGRNGIGAYTYRAWVRELHGGDIAIAMFNQDSESVRDMGITLQVSVCGVYVHKG